MQPQPERTSDQSTDIALQTSRSDDGSTSDSEQPGGTEYSGQISELDAKVNRLLREKESLIRQAETREREIIDDLNKRANHHNHRVSRLRDQARNQKTVIKKLEQQIYVHKEKIAKLQAMVIARQESALESLNAGKGLAPMDDHEVQGALIRLQENIRSWARKYAVSDVARLENVSEAELDLVVVDLGTYCSEPSWLSLVNRLSISVDKIPAILMQAALANMVFEWIFGNPFFLFRRMETTDSLPLSDGLGQIYGQMRLVDEVEGHAWRSQMLRVLCLPSGQSAKSFLRGQIDSLSSDLAQFFLDSSANALLEKSGGPLALYHRVNELENVLAGAAHLALSLWTQRTNMICYSLDQVDYFWNGDPIAEAHRLHHLDDDDGRLDGTDIVLFVQPALVAFGSVHGEHDDESKIWAAATVLVSDRIADTEPDQSFEMSSSIKAEELDQGKIFPETESSTKLAPS
ncbi:uncharacterized protein BO95DRAFT_369359 [Aspergillus brunneoviolaceus CBS 621.78]|uniref:Uncharacterized protein n=1 Tax=Aspergillus brunneoviolaceus CBS 621.78 TaxID=1450534 RepID=A0ACD1G1C8_9EURO|nr:hypothetical protein BO95DRAFT_369359 [Aspergillus brunneoviolaceus CBS 621.78]RAH43078.1 hypothetical protein BO95DRAFT_369359 [Aspergillus brunneoviolaceus CBS 621.78]